MKNIFKKIPTQKVFLQNFKSFHHPNLSLFVRIWIAEAEEGRSSFSLDEFWQFVAQNGAADFGLKIMISQF